MTARPDIVYVHHGAARIYDTVVAIRRAGYSCLYLSGYYYFENGLFERTLRLLGAHRLLARLRRRHHLDLPPDAVERSFVLEAMMAIEVRFPRLLPNFVIWRNRYIDLRAARRIRRLRPRAVISCDTHSLFTFRAAKRIGTVAVLDQMTGHLAKSRRIFAEEARLHPDAATEFRLPPESQVRRCIAEALEADHVLAPSDYVRTSLIEIGVPPERISLLPYGADTAMFARDDEPPAPPVRLLYAGHVAQRKGVRYLLEAMRALGRDDVELTLLGRIEGSGAWLAPYRDLFVHRAHLPHAEIPDIFRTAHVYVYPSLHEGSTVSVYEAMATGLPVIATDNSGSVVRDGVDGFIVAIRDVDALRDRIGRLCDDAALRARMGRAARDRAREFTWEAYAHRLSDILAGLLE